MHSRLWLAILLFTLSLSACRSWDETRKGFVDPVNAFLHQRYPAAWRTMVLEDILDFYSPELLASEGLGQKKRELLDRFLNIERAEEFDAALLGFLTSLPPLADR